jgi:putative ABC transport system ATP-binding protein
VSTEPIVEAVDVARTYAMQRAAVEALKGVTLRVMPGDFVAIMGPSGSGKSTLLHLLGAVDTPTRGAVRLTGIDVASLDDRERTRLRLLRVGLVFQRFHLLPMLTARENVELPMAEAGVARGEREGRALKLLERVGLGHRVDHRPGRLSGGEHQRVAIARALANQPRLIVADEPTGELDSRTSESILDLFRDLNGEGATIVVATHDAHLAEGATSRRQIEDGLLV